MDYNEIINKEPLGSIERLVLICNYGNPQASAAAARCIEKRLYRMSLKNKDKNGR